jgi:bifunctional non-homologous end joining protein LigD
MGTQRRAKELPGEAEEIDGRAFAPELCRSEKTPPAGDDWLHETKWDGYRILAAAAKGKVRLWSRNAIEWTHKVPELADAVAALGARSLQLDGEMVVLRGERDDFNALQARLSAENADPAIYVVFDIPHLDGRSLRKVPLVERKKILKQLLHAHPHPLLRYSEHQIGNGAAALARATSKGYEGIISKRVNSQYCGARNGDWVKVKDRPSDEFVVIGYSEPKGSRSGLGALLLAKPLDGRLVYIGRVGTGFTDAQLRSLRTQLEAARTKETTADLTLMDRKDRAEAHWTAPKLVVEVFYQGLGTTGLLRQPAFKTMRLDKKAKDLR